MARQVQEAEVTPPRDELVRRRWLPGRTVDWVRSVDAILTEHGSVHGSTVYDKRHRARWQARKLIDYMVDLGLHERWHLVEHVEKRDRGFVWAVEYVGPRRRG